MKKLSNLFWGVFLVICGVLLIAWQFSSFSKYPLSVFVATMFLVAAIIQSIASRKFWNIILPLTLLYVIFQKYFNLQYISPRILILSSVLFSIGLGTIFKPRFKAKPCQTHSANRNAARHNGSPPNTHINGNSPHEKVLFSGASKYLRGQEIESGHFSTTFGGLELHLEHSKLSPNGATFYIDCSFGAVEVSVPREWRVEENLSSFFGTIETNSHFAATNSAAPVLKLEGTVNFGILEIRYV